MANLGGGDHGDDPPGDPEALGVLLANLRTPTIYNAIRRAKLLGRIARYGFPESGAPPVPSALRRSRAAFCQSPTDSAGSIPFMAKA